MLNSDTPKNSIADDQFDSAKTFIPRLAQIVLKWPTNDGLVVGVFGPWGTGKTTTLSMLKSHIQKAYSQEIAIAEFSPWLYNDTASLIASFFSTIASEFNQQNKDWSQKAVQGFKAIGAFLAVASKGVSILGVSADLTKIQNELEAASEISKNSSDLVTSISELANTGEVKLRKSFMAVSEILTELGQSGGRLLILIDDIDRISKEELLSTLRLIRIAKELPYTTIITAMDEERVRNILEEASSDGYGEDYLDKIIQIPIHIPIPSPSQIAKLLSTGLRETLVAINRELPAQLDASRPYMFDELNLITHTISTPRDLARYMNGVRSLLLTLDEPDLNIVDVALIEALRLSYPNVYSRIRKSKAFLTKATSSRFDTESDTSERELNLSKIINGPSTSTQGRNDAIVRQIVESIFGDVTRPGRITTPEEDRIERRLRSPEFFDSYFGHPPSPGKITSKKATEYFQAIVNCATRAPASSIVDAILLTFQDLTEQQSHQMIEEVTYRFHSTTPPILEKIAKASIASVDRFSQANEHIPQSLIGKALTTLSDAIYRQSHETASTIEPLSAIAHCAINSSLSLACSRALIDPSRYNWASQDELADSRKTWICRAISEITTKDFISTNDLDTIAEVVVGIVKDSQLLGENSPFPLEALRTILKNHIDAHPTDLPRLLYCISIVGMNRQVSIINQRQPLEKAVLLLSHILDGNFTALELAANRVPPASWERDGLGQLESDLASILREATRLTTRQSSKV